MENYDNKIETSTAKQLLKKIEKLEEGHDHFKEEMSKLMIYGERKISGGRTVGGVFVGVKPDTLEICSSPYQKFGGGTCLDRALKLTEAQCVNILQSMGQSVYMFDLNGHIVYWSQMAQNLYGYTAAEATGRTALEIIIRPKYAELATLIVQHAAKGESWGTLNGVLCVCVDTRPFRELRPGSSVSVPWRISSAKFGLDTIQPLRTTISSKISNMASKVKLKIKTGLNNLDHEYVFLSSKAEEWMDKNGISWPWKGNERGSSGIRTGHFGWPWLHNDLEQESAPHMSSSSSLKVEIQLIESESACNTNDAPGSWTSSCSLSSSGSTKDVAVKVFTIQEYPDDMILSFRKEVSLMKRLRHPNIILFMGAVTSPQHLCIVTEFLSRLARGMNYLHHCQPPIIHRDLKSSNLLVDKNWTVKVGDSGLSRIKRQTYLSTKTGNGTPQWMALEILRNDQDDEKSDVYSYGVVLWEIATGKIPWDNLNAMQCTCLNSFPTCVLVSVSIDSRLALRLLGGSLTKLVIIDYALD
nr:hypothetical protein [Tanacetum cinerariifolium]